MLKLNKSVRVCWFCVHRWRSAESPEYRYTCGKCHRETLNNSKPLFRLNLLTIMFLKLHLRGVNCRTFAPHTILNKAVGNEIKLRREPK
jgi:hypothetical protein